MGFYARNLDRYVSSGLIALKEKGEQRKDYGRENARERSREIGQKRIPAERRLERIKDRKRRKKKL